MSIECGVCERDLRSGHAPTCTRRQLAPNRKPAVKRAPGTPRCTHTRHKSYEEIKAQCEQLGLSFNDTLYKSWESDHVVIEGGGARVLYDTFNGRFFGKTDTGVVFHLDTTEHDAEPWFQALLDFFLAGRKETTT